MDKCKAQEDAVKYFSDEYEAALKAGKDTRSIVAELAIATNNLFRCQTRPKQISLPDDLQVQVLTGAISASLLDSQEAALPLSLKAFLDDWYCGTPPHLPWPPSPIILQLLGDLAESAAALAETSTARIRFGEAIGYLTRLVLVGPQIQGAKK